MTVVNNCRVIVTDDMVAEALDAKASMSQLHMYLYSTEKCRCGEDWTDAHWMRFILERAISVAEEPEWEYGVRLHPDIEYKPNENRAAYTPPTTPHTTLERAQEMAGLNPRYRATYHRRVKAGPWEPLEN